MYVGRLLLVGASKSGGVVAAYRLASRSFPHRRIEFDVNTKTAHVVPLIGHEEEIRRNPLLAYPCLQIINKNSTLVANGSHLEDVREKMSVGLPPERAMAQVLLELGPEHDADKTPRIVGLASQKEHVIGVISNRGLIVRSFPFEPGLAYYVATYRKTAPSENVLRNFDLKTAKEAVKTIHERYIFRDFTHPICTIASFTKNRVFEIGIYPDR